MMLWTDGGGKGAATSPHPVQGQEAVVEPPAGVAANAAGDRALGICSVTRPDKLTRIPR